MHRTKPNLMKGEPYPFNDSISTVLFLLLCLQEPHTCPLRTETKSSPALRKGQEMFFNQVESGQRVKVLRKENGYTLQQMADELNVSYEHYKKIENGNHDYCFCKVPEVQVRRSFKSCLFQKGETISGLSEPPCTKAHLKTA